MGNGDMSADFFDHDFAVAEFPRRTDNTQNFFHFYHLGHTTIPEKVGCFFAHGIRERIPSNGFKKLLRAECKTVSCYLSIFIL
jgi:hypothetical protein